jgi:hypothetical protein
MSVAVVVISLFSVYMEFPWLNTGNNTLCGDVTAIIGMFDT